MRTIREYKTIPLFKEAELEKDEAVKTLEHLITEVKAGNIKSYCVAAEMKDGSVACGWTNASILDRQVLVSHLQIDIMWKITRVNLELE